MRRGEVRKRERESPCLPLCGMRRKQATVEEVLTTKQEAGKPVDVDQDDPSCLCFSSSSSSSDSDDHASDYVSSSDYEDQELADEIKRARQLDKIDQFFRRDSYRNREEEDQKKEEEEVKPAAKERFLFSSSEAKVFSSYTTYFDDEEETDEITIARLFDEPEQMTRVSAGSNLADGNLLSEMSDNEEGEKSGSATGIKVEQQHQDEELASFDDEEEMDDITIARLFDEPEQMTRVSTSSNSADGNLLSEMSDNEEGEKSGSATGIKAEQQHQEEELAYFDDEEETDDIITARLIDKPEQMTRVSTSLNIADGNSLSEMSDNEEGENSGSAIGIKAEQQHQEEELEEEACIGRHASLVGRDLATDAVMKEIEHECKFFMASERHIIEADYWNRKFVPYAMFLKKFYDLDERLKLKPKPKALFRQLRRWVPCILKEHSISGSSCFELQRISFLLETRKAQLLRVKRVDRRFDFALNLVTSKPYIKESVSVEQIRKDLGDKIPKFLPGSVVDDAIEFFNEVLHYMEPEFHPLIREGHKEILQSVISKIARAEHCMTEVFVEQFDQIFDHDVIERVNHLIDIKKKGSELYREAERQVILHEQFDQYLSSEAFTEDLRQHMLLDDLDVECVSKHEMVHNRFSELDQDLIEISLRERLEFLKLCREVDIYHDRFKHLHEEGKEVIDKLMQKFTREKLLEISDMKEGLLISEIGQIKATFFDELPLYYTIQGIMESLRIVSKHSELEEVLSTCNQKCDYLHSIWEDTRHYDHRFYKVLRQPLSQGVFSGEMYWNYQEQKFECTADRQN